MALTLVVPTGEIVRTLTVYKGDKKMHQNSNHRARKTGTGCNRGRVPDEPDHPAQWSAETTCAGCKETQSRVQHPAGPTTALRSRRVALLSGSTPARSFSGVSAVQGSSLKKKVTFNVSKICYKNSKMLRVTAGQCSLNKSCVLTFIARGLQPNRLPEHQNSHL